MSITQDITRDAPISARPLISLKHVKYSAFASDESLAFTATVYVDGRFFCHVSNDGKGGDVLFDGRSGFAKRRDALDAIIAATYPALRTSERITACAIPASLSLVIGDVMSAWIIVREMRSIERAHGERRLVGIVKGDLVHWKPEPRTIDRSAWCEYERGAIRHRHPGVVFWDDLTLDQRIEAVSGGGNNATVIEAIHDFMRSRP